MEAADALRRRMLRLTLACAATVLLVVGVSLGSAFWIRARNDADSRTVSNLFRGSEGLSVSLVDQETGVRGYVVTGDARFLDPYRSGAATTVTLLARLRGLLAGDQEGLDALARVQHTYRQWKTQIAEPEVDAVGRGDGAAAVALESTGAGKARFDSVRAALARLDARIDADRADRLRDIDASTVAVLFVAVVIAAAGSGLSLWFVVSYRRWGARELAGSQERRVRELAEAREQRWMTNFAHLSERLNRAEALDQVARTLAEEAATPVEGRFVHLGLINRDGDLEMVYDRDFARIEDAPPLRRRGERTPLAETVRTGHSIVIGEAPGAIPMSEVADFAALAETAGVVAITTTPLTQTNGEILGALAIMWDQPVALDALLRSRLDEIAALAAEALRRAELFEVGRRLAALSSSLASALTDEEVGRVVVGEASRVLGARMANLARLDPDGGTVRVVHAERVDRGAVPVAIPLSARTPLTDVIRDGRPLVISHRDDYLADNPRVVEEMEQLGIDAGLALPLRVRGRVVGSLSFGWAHPRVITPGEAPLTTVIELASAALERAAIFHANTRVAAFAAELASATSTADVAAAVFEVVAGDVLDASGIRLAVREGDDHLAVFHGPDTPAPLAESFSRIPLSADFALAVAARTDRPVVVTDSAAIGRTWPHLAGAIGEVARVEAVPLHDSAGKVIGVLSVVWRDRVTLDSTTATLLETVVELCGATLERLDLYHLEHQLVLNMAQHLSPAHVSIPGIESAGRYEPALAALGMGGDWYDLIALEDGTVGAIVGDMVGHGITAVADMAEFKASLATLIRTGIDVDDIFVTLDSLLPARSAFRGTALFASIDPAACTLRLAVAGHPPAIIRRADGRTAPVSGAARYPGLGIGVRSRQHAETVEFGHDDLFCAYTDGLIERRGESLDEGIARLVEVLAEVGDRDLDEVADALSRSLMVDAADDVAFLLVRNRPER